MKLYEKVADQIRDLVEVGTYRCGERVPSVRALSRQLRVSVSTVLEAYRLLEDHGLLEARPQSGYYVCKPLKKAGEFQTIQPGAPLEVACGSLTMELLQDPGPQVLDLGCAGPNPNFMPTGRLNRSLAKVAKEPTAGVGYERPPGSEKLRVQLARRALAKGCSLSPDDFVLTLGCQEALYLSLRATCKPGDSVAVESPTFYGMLQVVEMLGLKVVEIPSHPSAGMSLPALSLALEQMKISAVMVTPCYNNPTGSCMDESSREELVRMLAAAEVPLIEDDVYGDLHFSRARPRAAKSFDQNGLVLYCSSFSKTLAAGYRVGWVAPGRFLNEVKRLKVLSNLASPGLLSEAMAEYLQTPGFEQVLKKVRREYCRTSRLMADAVLQSFPAGTKVSQPQGGFVLWVELPAELDSLELYPLALAQGVRFAPGPVFSAGDRYKNCLRITASEWSPEIEAGIVTLGRLAHAALQQ